MCEPRADDNYNDFEVKAAAVYPKLYLYHPTNPDDILTATFRTNDRVIYVTAVDEGAPRMNIVCTKPEEFEAKVKKYAQDEGYLMSKPRYHARESKVVWTIEAQKDTAVTVGYTIDGAYKRATFNVPGLAKNMNIDLLRDIINVSVQNEIKRTRLVGISGTFTDTSLSKLDEADKEVNSKNGTN